MRALILCLVSLSACAAPPPSWTFEGEEIVSNDGAWAILAHNPRRGAPQ